MLRADLADMLRSEGHDVLTAREAGQAKDLDARILVRCIEEDRILVTLDDDFGNVMILPLSKHPGVIRVKVHPPTTEAIFGLLHSLVADADATDFKNHLIIVSSSTIRRVHTADRGA